VAQRKSILLRLDPRVHDALARWAAAELRSTNAQIEYLLRQALDARGLLPSKVGEIRRPDRPPAAGRPNEADEAGAASPDDDAPLDHADPGSGASDVPPEPDERAAT
jgi:hypothetical protein